eukprot:g27909.t1
MLIVYGGALWALANYLVLPLVKLLGIGLGFSLYHFVNLVVGYGIGRFGIFNMEKLTGNVEICDIGCCLVLVSFVIMVFVEEAGDKQQDLSDRQGLAESTQDELTEGGRSEQQSNQDFREKYTRWREDHVAPARRHSVIEAAGTVLVSYSTGETGGQLKSVGGFSASAEPNTAAGRVGRKAVGVLLALLAGTLTGVQSVPASLYNQRYAAVAKLSGWRVPHAPIRPAYLSGCIWAVGFTFMITGISSLGFSIGYTLDAVGPIVIASLLSVFVFKDPSEISERNQLILYSVAFGLQLIGVLCISPEALALAARGRAEDCGRRHEALSISGFRHPGGLSLARGGGWSELPASTPRHLHEEVLLSGWLEKRLPVLRDTWEPHWCVLRQSSLACYEAERECSVPKLELRVLKWAAFREEDAFGDAQLHRKTRPCGFVLDLGTDVPHAHQRFVHFDAATEAQLQRWLEAFQALQLPASESPQASDATPSPKGYAISVRKRTFLYRKHTYKLRKNRPRNQVTATDDWLDEPRGGAGRS